MTSSPAVYIIAPDEDEAWWWIHDRTDPASIWHKFDAYTCRIVATTFDLRGLTNSAVAFLGYPVHWTSADIDYAVYFLQEISGGPMEMVLA